MKIALTVQIGELSGELELREQEFQAAVGRGKMRAAEAEYRLASLKAALATLLFVQEHEETIRDAVKAVSQ